MSDTKKFLYFAYCVNMLSSRMECCVAKSVKKKGVGKLQDHELAFGTYSRVWEGMLPTLKPKKSCVVWGAQWEVLECFRPKLDSLQGVNEGVYKPITVHLTSMRGRGGTYEALSYVLNKDPEEPIIKRGVPVKRFRMSKLYLDELCEGGEEACLPAYYKRYLRSLPHNGYTGSVLPRLQIPSVCTNIDQPSPARDAVNTLSMVLNRIFHRSKRVWNLPAREIEIY